MDWKLALVLSASIFTSQAHADSVAQVLGGALGSLDCVDINDVSSKRVCEARAVSNGGGCRQLSSSADREACLDRSVFPRKARLARLGGDPIKTDLRWPPTEQAAPAAPRLPGTELDRIAGGLGISPLRTTALKP